MSSNVGLTTPRGSGTSGYVQRNLSSLRPPSHNIRTNSDSNYETAARPRQPDAEILAHDRKREVEVKVFALQDRLEDEGVDEDEVEKQTSALRKVLLAEMEEGMANGLGRSSGKGLKPHQVHERAEAKIVESERLRKALGIGEGYVEGQHWGRGKDGERR